MEAVGGADRAVNRVTQVEGKKMVEKIIVNKGLTNGLILWGLWTEPNSNHEPD